jgi:nicotinamidase-related amidase
MLNLANAILEVSMMYAVSRCLHVIAEMGVADALGDDTRTAVDLAETTAANSDALARADEPVVTKPRISAFEGTDLKVLLRSKDIDTLVLFGIITSGVVLSTALEAMDQDYRVLIVRDACADSDRELHACLLDRLLAKRTDVVTAAEIAQHTQAQ